jgi:hypothetical protein
MGNQLCGSVWPFIVFLAIALGATLALVTSLQAFKIRGSISGALKLGRSIRRAKRRKRQVDYVQFWETLQTHMREENVPSEELDNAHLVLARILGNIQVFVRLVVLAALVVVSAAVFTALTGFPGGFLRFLFGCVVA